MHLNIPSITAWSLCFLPYLASLTAGTNSSEAAFDQTLLKYKTTMHQLLADGHSKACNTKTASVRRSWDDLNDSQRLDYIKAVKCLSTLPSKVDKSLAPGAASRTDDFVYSHINQTNFMHGSGIFLPWHRQFAHTNCLCQGKKMPVGDVPYWDWFKHSEDQAASPVFSAGPTGFGGNGIYIPHGPSNDSLPGVPGPTYVDRGAGTGGGCITDGAFADLVVHLGPVVPADTPVDDPYGL
ncbi:hypothetical protein G7046_g5802 [Stylonectria norvegica]|nr:hypothetical protein G7046_g5802 [Stylonectria norvegica]